MKKTFEQRRAQCFEDLKKSPLSKVRRITEDDKSSLGKMFEQYHAFQTFMESSNGAASLGPIPVIALEALTAFYGVSCIPAVASIQPIDAQKGFVYFKQRIARYENGDIKQKGTVKDGDLLRGLPSTSRCICSWICW